MDGRTGRSRMSGEIGFHLALSVGSSRVPMEDGCTMSLSPPRATCSPTLVRAVHLGCRQNIAKTGLKATTRPSASSTLPVQALLPPHTSLSAARPSHISPSSLPPKVRSSRPATTASRSSSRVTPPAGRAHNRWTTHPHQAREPSLRHPTAQGVSREGDPVVFTLRHSSASSRPTNWVPLDQVCRATPQVVRA